MANYVRMCIADMTAVTTSKIQNLHSGIYSTIKPSYSSGLFPERYKHFQNASAVFDFLIFLCPEKGIFLDILKCREFRTIINLDVSTGQ